MLSRWFLDFSWISRRVIGLSQISFFFSSTKIGRLVVLRINIDLEIF